MVLHPIRQNSLLIFQPPIAHLLRQQSGHECLSVGMTYHRCFSNYHAARYSVCHHQNPYLAKIQMDRKSRRSYQSHCVKVPVSADVAPAEFHCEHMAHNLPLLETHPNRHVHGDALTYPYQWYDSHSLENVRRLFSSSLILNFDSSYPYQSCWTCVDKSQ